ncbi:MAG TPA: acetylpolyamine amidohydrolase [Anaerolineae bacterium]|nr:acetylpolyamine amidohydrolase [Anaerolineae bacterium]HPL27179.1 acetylpolyamine amidohydrolase [Anaerolineae bacterium]
MFRMRRIFDDTLPANREAIAQVQEIVRVQFGPESAQRVGNLPDWMHDPLRRRFRSILIVADDLHRRVKGFALLMHAPDLDFCFLDYIATASGRVGRGIGGALYERVREEALALRSQGLFFECLPDDPALCRNPQTLKQNAARLRFYERYGARPIAGTIYETPLTPGADCPPYLMYDNLGQAGALSQERGRTIVRAILEREYGTRCPPGYIDEVAASFRDDPVRLREPRYIKREAAPAHSGACPADERIALVVNDQQAIHHVHERGYVEAPARIDAILKGLQRSDLFERMEPRHFGDAHIRAVHDREFLAYLRRMCENLEPGASVYPYVFPIRNVARPPKDMAMRAGYYCIDTFTPLSHNAYPAARRAVDCAITAAREVQTGRRLAYALVRPPGHHAERRAFGGFCYLNSTAIAAHYLSAEGRVAVLDLDYHHGNGTQEIFYERADVLTVSIHGQPSFAYPYFSGFAGEKGRGAGEGYNLNLPLPEEVDGAAYSQALQKALARVRRFEPQFVVVALGLDTAKHDPTGTWALTGEDLEANGRMVGELRLPTLVVQEGGYYTRSLGRNALCFLRGLWAEGRP